MVSSCSDVSLYNSIILSFTLVVLFYSPSFYFRCAHDRFLFGRAGWGRLSVGLYGLFLEKWLEHFSLSQFLVTRLEDFDTDKRAYIRRIYVFLGLREPTESEWFEILIPKRFNENKLRHEPMLPATEKLLRDFYAPFNEILASILMDSRYTWRDTQADIKFDKDKILEIAPILWTPATFDTSDLPQGPPSGITDWLLQYIDPKTPPKDLVSAGKQLALAIIALDIPALKYLLKDVGVPVTVVADEDTKQPPFVSLALVSSLAEGHSRSHVFKLLKGERSWISDLMRPPLPDSMHSVHAKDITESLNEAILNVSKWFIRAGADMNATDSHGYRLVV